MIERLARWRTPLAFALIVWLFFVANKAAYRGYFSSDDLDNIAWTSGAAFIDFAAGFLNPFYYSTNFRPVGHFYFWLMGGRAKLDFPPYVAVVHVLHGINIGLLWALLQRLRFGWPAQVMAVLFFGFHTAVFDAYWKPMYIFDILCAFFSLLSILCWMDKRRWVSLLCFWAAYKSKELAVAAPIILAMYEYLLADGAIRKLAFHLFGAVWFGAQAVLSQAGKPGDYGIRVTPLTLWQTADFYMSRVLILAHAGFALFVLPWWIRDPRLWWGLSACLLWLAPMLLVPGRVSGAYLYLPLAGVAVAFAALAERWNWRWTAIPLLAWLGWQYVELRQLRSTALAEAGEARIYVTSLEGLARGDRDLDTFLIDGAPPGMQRWGIEGALRYLYRKPDLQYIYLDDPLHPAPKTESNFVVLSWDPALRRVLSLRRSAVVGDAPYIEMTALTPVWQLETGWYQREGAFRWTMPKAEARLRRPDGAREFSVTVNIGPDYIRAVKQATLRVLLDDIEIGSRVFAQPGWVTERFPIASGAEGPVKVTFLVDPPFRPGQADPRLLGIPVGSFGFR